MRILAFAASSSRKSINRELAVHAAGLLKDARIEALDLNDYEVPLFSVDREEELGQPQPALDFLARIAASDALIISFAEHNGSYTAAWKNLFDWCSRIERRVFQDKPMVLLSASPGPGGAANVLAAAVASAPFFGGVVKGSLSVPKYHEIFDPKTGGVTYVELQTELQDIVSRLEAEGEES